MGGCELDLRGQGRGQATAPVSMAMYLCFLQNKGNYFDFMDLGLTPPLQRKWVHIWLCSQIILL